jgi:hemerythrin-like domain-containing protein
MQGNLMKCNDGFHHREEEALYKGGMRLRGIARKSFEIPRLNSENIKRLTDNFETLPNNDSVSKHILNTAELAQGNGTRKNLTTNMDQLQIKCQEITEIINDVSME